MHYFLLGKAEVLPNLTRLLKNTLCERVHVDEYQKKLNIMQ